MELFGQAFEGEGGYSASRLVEDGYARAKAADEPGLVYRGQRFCPFSLMRAVGRFLQEAHPAEVTDMRTWSLDRWLLVLDQHEILPHVKAPASGSLPEWMGQGDSPLVHNQIKSFKQLLDILTMHISREFQEKARAGRPLPAVFQPPAEGTTQTNTLAEGVHTAEPWSAEGFAKEMMPRLQEWADLFTTTVENQLQAAHNEGRLLDAVRAYGQDAKVARVPDAEAPSNVRLLFLGDDGEPKAFPVQELLKNGVNAGLPPADWKATIHPVYSGCRSDVVPVPPGARVVRSGHIRREGPDV